MHAIEVLFSEVRPGEKFISKKTKRFFGGVKIHEAMYLGKDGASFMPNAIILTDHVGDLAEDAGTLSLSVIPR